MRLVALFTLNPDRRVEADETWARTVDLPRGDALPSVDSFTFNRVTGQLGSNAPAPYPHLQIIDVPDRDGFGKDVSSAAMQAVATSFRSMADIDFLTVEPLTA